MNILVDYTELGFDKIGMMTGPFAQVKRFGLMFSLATTYQFIFKPSFSFDANGAKKWKIFDKENGTYTPWWLLSTLFAAPFALLI